MPEDQAALHGGYKRGVTGGRATSANRSSSAALLWQGADSERQAASEMEIKCLTMRSELSLLRSFAKRRA